MDLFGIQLEERVGYYGNYWWGSIVLWPSARY